jgi:hypothetical protein
MSRTVKVWPGDFLDHYVAARDGIDQIPCGQVRHHKDAWFIDCEHTPHPRDLVESACALCDENADGDNKVLEAISSTYFQAWTLHRRVGSEHIEQWPLALIILAGLREAGFEVVRRDMA